MVPSEKTDREASPGRFEPLFGGSGVSAIWGTVALTILIALFFSWLLLSYAKQSAREQMVESMSTVLAYVHHGLKELWLMDQMKEVEGWAESRQVTEILPKLLAREESGLRQGEPKTPGYDALCQSFQEFMASHFVHTMLLVSKEGRILASSSECPTGEEPPSLPVDHALQRVLAGESVFVPSLSMTGSLAGLSKKATMMSVMAPVRGEDKQVMGALVFVLDPADQFSKALQADRLGVSGQVYAFDRQGILLSQMEKTGEQGFPRVSESSTFPAQALETFMSEQALAGINGSSSDPYLDHRGVPVLGVWLWDNALQIGLAIEIADAEALQSFFLLQRVVFILSFFASLFVLAMTQVAGRNMRQAAIEVKKREEYLNTIFQSAFDPILTANEDGVIEMANQKTGEVFGYEPDELIGENLKILMPKTTAEKHDGDIHHYLETEQSNIIGVGRQVEGQRKDGTLVPIFLALSEAMIGGKRLFIGVLHDLTRIKRLEKEQLESQEALLATLETISEGIIALDHDGAIAFCNERLFQLWEIPPSFAKQTKVEPLLNHMESLLVKPQVLVEYMERELSSSMEFFDVLELKNGRVFERWSRRRRMRNGEVWRVASFRDVTHLKQVESELRGEKENLEQVLVSLAKSEKILRLALEGAQAGYMLYDLERDELQWDARSMAIVGMEPRDEALKAKDWIHGIAPEDLDQTMRRYVDVLKNPQALNVDFYYRVRRPDGSLCHVHFTGLIERDDEGFAENIYGLLFDDTERMRYEANLIRAKEEAEQAFAKVAKNERVLRMALAGAQAGYAHLNLATNQIFLDEYSRKLYGMAEQASFTFDDWRNMLEPDDTDRVKVDHIHTMADPNISSFRQHFKLRRADNGEVRSMYFTGHIERNGQGEATSVYGLVVDETERRLAEEELKRAKEAAEAATEVKSQFLANMSHEIRTPMNAIIGMSHLALQTDLDKQQQRYLERINTAAHSLLGIINDILDFSKIEAGKLALESVDFHLQDVLDNIASLIADRVQKKGLEYCVQVDPEVPQELIGDSLRLGQVLLNLVSNAVKFTSVGRVSMTITIKERREGGGIVLKFSVRDTGIGLSSEQQTMLFQPFNQVDGSYTRKYGGTGLGLVISKKLVEMMGGEIGVESEIDVGSTFFFTAAFRVSSEETLSEWHMVELAKLRVLTLMLSSHCKTVVHDLLGHYGCRFDSSDNRNQIVTMLANAASEGDVYRVLLIDWHCLNDDGEHYLRQLRMSYPADYLTIGLVVDMHEGAKVAGLLEENLVTELLVRPIAVSAVFELLLRSTSLARGGASSGASARRGSVATPKFPEANVLLVEDDEVNQELACELLARVGILADVAENGQEAIQKVGEKAYDLVLMDVQMPVMDGYSASRAIRADERFSDLPIIAMTANAMAGDREKCLAAGMNDHVAKPIIVGELYGALGRWLEAISEHEPDNAPLSLDSEDDGIPGLAEALLAAPNLPGIDMRLGFEHLGAADWPFYHKLLAKFHQNYQNFLADFSQNFATEGREGATRLAHTLKGTAGNLGMVEVQKQAKALEFACKDGLSGDALDAVIEDLAAVLQPVLTSLSTMFAEEEAARKEVSASAAKPVDVHAVHVQIEHLEALLHEHDADALDVVEQLETLLTASAVASDMRALVAEVEGFRFKEALATLEKVKKGLLAE